MFLQSSGNHQYYAQTMVSACLLDSLFYNQYCGCLLYTSLALKLGDYCITEAGFGSDLGAEKFFDIKDVNKRQEVLEAARLANVDGFVEKLPDKWDTMIGENGCELSGGERQRISIARAFLKNAPIILLDEATASLDVENETLIQESLSRLIQDKTVMIIVHRMRTVAGADKIVVLSDEMCIRDRCQGV